MPAGHYAKLDLLEKSPSLRKTCYWDLKFTEPENPSSKEEYLEELDRLFKQAVQRQLVSDVELGAYLSGGMDSGSITAIASQSFEYLKSFTCGFDLSSASGLEACFDERATAEALSYAFKTEHYEVVLKAGDMERCLPSLAWHLEEPRVGQSYPNFYAAKLASKFVKVVLSGAGGMSFSLVIHGDTFGPWLMKTLKITLISITFTGRDWLVIPILKIFFHPFVRMWREYGQGIYSGCLPYP